MAKKNKVPDNVIVANNQQNTQPQAQQPTPTPNQSIKPNQERAIHRINLSSIRHNYNEVQKYLSFGDIVWDSIIREIE